MQRVGDGVFKKSKNGWRADVERAGGRRIATRPTKAEAQAWAVAEEAAILSGARGEYPRHTLAETVERYRREVTDSKTASTSRADNLRFDAWLHAFPELANKVLHEVTADDLANWHDARLKQVSGSSVLREAQQYRPVWTIAVKQWKWAGARNTASGQSACTTTHRRLGRNPAHVAFCGCITASCPHHPATASGLDHAGGIAHRHAQR